MKKNKMLFASLLLLLFATYSCAVEEIQPEPIPILSEIQKKVNPIFLEHDLSVYKIKPIWKSLITFDNIDAVEVNFTQDKKTTIPLSKNGKIRGRQRLLLTFDNGKIRETIIEYIPSDDYMGDIKEINSGNFKSKQFDGEITFKKANENRTIVWYIVKGKVEKKATRTPKKIKRAKTARYITVFVCRYVEICVGPGGEEICNTQEICHFEDVWIDDPEPENPPVDPLEPVDPYDCAVNPSAPWCNDGGGGGGGPIDPPVDECVDFDPNSDNYSETAELISSVLISNNGSSVKKHYTWRCGKGIWYDVYSVEEGELEFTGNSNLPYKWISLEHKGCYIEGGMICGSASIGLDTGVSNVGIYSATMQLAIGINSAYTAAGTPINRYFSLSPIKHFNSNE